MKNQNNVENSLREIAKYWNDNRDKKGGFDIEHHASASGRGGAYIVYSGHQVFIPGLSIRKAAGFELSMWAVYFGGK